LFRLSLTSLLAGVSVTAVVGWIASFIAFRKDERAVLLEQVTKERTKWRDSMRKLCEEIAIAHVENQAIAIPATVVSLRARNVHQTLRTKPTTVQSWPTMIGFFPASPTT
jgi:hypothetical protein